MGLALLRGRLRQPGRGHRLPGPQGRGPVLSRHRARFEAINEVTRRPHKGPLENPPHVSVQAGRDPADWTAALPGADGPHRGRGRADPDAPAAPLRRRSGGARALAGSRARARPRSSWHLRRRRAASGTIPPRRPRRPAAWSRRADGHGHNQQADQDGRQVPGRGGAELAGRFAARPLLHCADLPGFPVYAAAASVPLRVGYVQTCSR
jgi:hypothetical protein